MRPFSPSATALTWGGPGTEVSTMSTAWATARGLSAQVAPAATWGGGLGPVDLSDREVVARLEQVERHGAAHDAQADETHLHDAAFPSNAQR